MTLRLGYLVPEFPSQTHAFFWREIQALRALGLTVLPISTRKPQTPCRHDFVTSATAETRYLFPPSASTLRAIATSVGLREISGALSYLAGLEHSSIQSRVRHCALLASALELKHWSLKMQIDHIHAHSCADTAHVLALLRRMGGPPYSLTLHGDLEVYGDDHRSKMRDAAFISVVGSHLRQQVMERVGVSADRILLTFMGLEVEKLTPLGRDRSFRAGALHMATVARLHPNKGHHHALAAMEQGLRAGLDLRYTIAGEGPFRGEIAARIDALDLGGRVTLTGALSEPEVFALLSKADAFLLPSTGVGEAWPVSVMEAMGAGLPVISSIIGATPEMIAPGVDGFLVPQGDEAALLGKITLLANDIDARRRIGDAAHNAAVRRFDVAVTAGALHDAINTSLTGHRLRVA